MITSGIQVIIGLIFIFSLLSILATQINTIIANVLQMRAGHLRLGLQALITDPTIRARFYAHPLIRILEPLNEQQQEIVVASAQAAAEMMASEPTNNVTWITPETFAEVLMDILAERAVDDLYGPFADKVEEVLTGAERARMRALVTQIKNSGIGLNDLEAAVAALADHEDQRILNEELAEVKALRRELLAEDNETTKLIPLLAGLAHVHDPYFRRVMNILLGAANTLQEAQTRLQNWFVAGMDQLTIVYRRYLNYVSLGVGLALAVLLNVDAVHMTRVLWSDPATRTDLINAIDLDALGTLMGEIDGVTTATPAPTVAPTADPLAPTVDPALDPSLDPSLDPALDPALDPSLDPALDPSLVPSPDLPPDSSFPTALPPLATIAPNEPLVPLPTVEPATGASANGSIARIAYQTAEDANDVEQALSDSVAAAVATLNELLNLDLPVGWHITPLENIDCFPDAEAEMPAACNDRRNLLLMIPGYSRDYIGFVLSKLLGWAITTIAIAQGAPFWFDLLNRLVRGRSQRSSG
ncbi:MAG: hypothetical protein GYB67_01815 [Chloroflexi bacterium]|nr:hypothetical protein [Chloroflexota bacterium]